MFGTLLNFLTRLLPTLLPKLVTERPDLLVDHALAYAALAKREIESIRRQLLRRVLAGAVALAATLAFVILAGVALMLCATTAVQTQIQADSAWVLLAVPGVMLVLAIVATLVALAKGKPRTESLTAQVQLDVQAFRTAMESRS